jgi:serine protease Do
MSRRFTFVTLALTAVVAFLVGTIAAGGLMRSSVLAGPPATAPGRPAVRTMNDVAAGSIVNFADIVERTNAAVVNIDATTRGRDSSSRPPWPTGVPEPAEPFGGSFDPGTPRPDRDVPRRGAGTGFIIDADGSILTNHHVVDRAERIIVTLSDGRIFRARVLGTDADTDIALIKIDGQAGLPVVRLGDSSTLRTGEWVCAIGNPFGYEHTVTVGVVSYIGRKLFDTSLDHYIQTDAAISFGNSGGPLINGRGEVVGINAAISSRANSIGFAVPMNTATTILPQLRAHGRVARGYIGVALKDVNPDLERSLGLTVHRGALVQDLTQGSPGQRAGIRPYDVIVSVDDDPVDTGEDLIRRISTRAPGSAASLRLVRDGHEQTVVVKLAERPARDWAGRRREPVSPPAAERRSDSEGLLGLTVRDMDRQTAERMRLPNALQGVLIARVEAVSPAFDAAVERGTVLLEMNRQRVETAADYRRIARAARPGDIVTLYVYSPDLEQRQLKTIRVEGR